jgi:PUA domain protein
MNNGEILEIKRRYYLKKKELKQIREELGKFFVGIDDIIPKKANVEIAITDEYDMILVDNKPVAVRLDNKLYPTLKVLLDKDIKEKRVVVDMGAVKFLANGADVMAPGIVEADENIKEGDVVFVVDEKHNKPLCVGEALMDGKTMKEANKGKAIKTIHHVGDEIWRF